MADATARLTGVPGVCLTTLGPGAANAVAGVAHAWLDRSPLLIFTAQKPDALLPHYTHQVLDLHALFAPVTKASLQLSPASVREHLAQALRLVTEQRPGPVHLQICNEDATLPVVDEPVRWPPVAPPAAPHPIALAHARAVLASARRPLIVAGLGLEPQRPYAALRQLAEVLDAPVLVTPKAKGAVPDDHALACATIGLTRSDPAYDLLAEADCLIAVGFDVVELVRPWQHPAPLIWIAPWSNRDPTLPCTVELAGDLATAMRGLAGSPRRASGRDANWGEARVAALRAVSTAIVLPAPAAGRILSQIVLQSLRRHSPPASVLAVDVGSHKIHSCLAWPALAPNRFLVSNGLSCMGYALPAAIGASLAQPGQPVFCLTGDAGLAMALGELNVLARLQLPVIVVVLSDGAIDLIRSQQLRAGRLVYGTEFPPPDFAQIATGFGIPAARVESAATLDAALAAAVARPGPSVIEVMLDPAGYPTTPQAVPRST
jgi:acetolactate synthase-1/2/3 large subunit